MQLLFAYAFVGSFMVNRTAYLRILALKYAP